MRNAGLPRRPENEINASRSRCTVVSRKPRLMVITRSNEVGDRQDRAEIAPRPLRRTQTQRTPLGQIVAGDAQPVTDDSSRLGRVM